MCSSDLDELYQRYLSATASAVLSDDEEKWLEQHGSIRIGWLNHDPGISEFDGESGKVKINENPLHLPDLLYDIRTIV